MVYSHNSWDAHSVPTGVWGDIYPGLKGQSYKILVKSANRLLAQVWLVLRMRTKRRKWSRAGLSVGAPNVEKLTVICEPTCKLHRWAQLNDFLFGLKYGWKKCVFLFRYPLEKGRYLHYLYCITHSIVQIIISRISSPNEVIARRVKTIQPDRGLLTLSRQIA